jgi:hypothetical protein
LKQKCDQPLSNFASNNFNLRQYPAAGDIVTKAGAYTRPLFSST